MREALQTWKRWRAGGEGEERRYGVSKESDVAIDEQDGGVGWRLLKEGPHAMLLEVDGRSPGRAHENLTLLAATYLPPGGARGGARGGAGRFQSAVRGPGGRKPQQGIRVAPQGQGSRRHGLNIQRSRERFGCIICRAHSKTRREAKELQVVMQMPQPVRIIRSPGCHNGYLRMMTS